MKHDLLSVGSIVIDRINGNDRRGGSGANVAVDSNNLGLDTALLSSFAQDKQGQVYLKFLQDLGIAIYTLNQQQEQTTICEFFITDEGITVDGEWFDNGLEEVFNSSHPDSKTITCATVVHLGTCVPSFALEVAKLVSNSQFLSYNPGAWIGTDLEMFTKTHPLAHYIFLNNLEANFLLTNGYINNPVDLASRPEQVVVVTNGAQGTNVYTSGETLQVPTFKIQPLEETGAGDAFASAFIWAQLKGHSFETSARLGNLLGACAVQNLGGQLNKDVIEQFGREAVKFGLLSHFDTIYFTND